MQHCSMRNNDKKNSIKISYLNIVKSSKKKYYKKEKKKYHFFDYKHEEI